MENTYWHKQKIDEPLFPELLWSRPQNKQTAGKLLIVGGNSHGFAAPAEAYDAAVKAGAGTAKVLLPDAIQKLVGKFIDAGEFAPSSPSGSFGQAALSQLLELADWADGILLAGDFGRNSETAVLLEKFTQEFKGQLTLTQDALDYFKDTPGQLLERPDTTLVANFSQLQKLASHMGTAFTSSMNLLQMVDALHKLTQDHPINVVTQHLANIFVSASGQVSSTPHKLDNWQLKIATHSAVWWLQNPKKSFRAISTSIIDCINA